MSNLTLREFVQTIFATAVFLPLMLPQGYVLGWFTDLLSFRARSAAEQTVLSTSLSLPLAIVLANIPARYLAPSAPLFLFLAVDLLAAVLLYQRWRRSEWPRFRMDKDTRLLLLCLCAGVLYIVVAGMPIEVHHRLFEPVFSSDWEIRLPLLQAAVRNGVPPRNPFFTYHDASPPVRYYFYWFSLCAQVMRLAHTDARSTLLASSVYSGISLVATLFLCLKYIFRETGRRLHRRCIVLLGLCCVLGLDVLPSLLGLAVWRVRLHPEVEWWVMDRSPGVLGALFYAPHHVAGAACGFVITLFLATLLEREHPPWRTIAVHCSVIALTFVALVGTSTYITLFFAMTIAVFFLVCLWQRNRRVALGLLAAGALAVIISLPYLHDLTARTVTASNGARPFHLQLRDFEFSAAIMRRTFHLLHRPPPNRVLRFILRGAILLSLYLCETGFFLIVVAVQLRRDLRSLSQLSIARRVLWVTAACLGFFLLFVTSSSDGYVNDLGVHAGLVLRLIFVLWGTEIVGRYLAERGHRRWTTAQHWTIRVATVCLALGVLMSLWQAALERTYLILLNAHAVPATAPFPHARHLAAMYEDVHAAQTVVAQQTPVHAVVQSNPLGAYQTVFRLYQQRRQAAGDLSCEGAFGGDPALCNSYVPELLQLFGMRSHTSTSSQPELPAPEKALSVQAMGAACAGIGLSAMIASNADPVWFHPESWVWRGELLYGNPHVRVVRCPRSGS